MIVGGDHHMCALHGIAEAFYNDIIQHFDDAKDTVDTFGLTLLITLWTDFKILEVTGF